MYRIRHPNTTSNSMAAERPDAGERERCLVRQQGSRAVSVRFLPILMRPLVLFPIDRFEMGMPASCPAPAGRWIHCRTARVWCPVILLKARRGCKRAAVNLEIAILSLHLHSDSYESSARMAESVDALVSNTNDREIVPVRSRLRVLL